MSRTLKLPCQAVVLRYVPDHAGGEALNVGVVVLSPGHRYMGARFLDSWRRIKAAFPAADEVHLRRVCSAVIDACARQYVDQLDLSAGVEDIGVVLSRALPDDDASIGRSAPLTGITAEPERTLGDLFERYVASRERSVSRAARSDEELGRGLRSLLRDRGVLGSIQTHVVRGKHYEETFDLSWMNHHPHVAKPLSFDLVDPQSIRRKAADWMGRISALQSTDSTGFHIVAGMPGPDADKGIRSAARDGFEILRDGLTDHGVEVLDEEDLAALADRIERDIRGDHAAE